MMDEAYLPVADILRKMLAFPVEIVDAEAGVRSRVYQCQIEMPDKAVHLPRRCWRAAHWLDAATVLRRHHSPQSYHRVGFTARLEETRDGE